MTQKEFITKMVDISHLEEYNCYGHYPFQLYVENLNGNREMNALALGGDVKAVYRRAGEYVKKGFKFLHLSLDFPASMDMKKDFVAVFSIIENKLTVIAIPYDVDNGNTFDIITESKVLNDIIENFKTVTNFK